MPTTRFNMESGPDLICLAHLRWEHMYGRPQHLMKRAARNFRVFYLEEARQLASGPGPHLEVKRLPSGVRVVVPYLPPGLVGTARDTAMRLLLADLFARYNIEQYVLWYENPADLAFTRHLAPSVVVYDCAADRPAGSASGLRKWEALEAELLRRADLVLTHGTGAYEDHRSHHPNVHAFPGTVDVAHFAQARGWQAGPADQRDIPHPRLGYFGPADERLDRDLIEQIATARPAWHLVFVAPAHVPALQRLPGLPNIHKLGRKSHLELPAYMAGWDAALLPLAVQAAPRIANLVSASACLAAGRAVIATPARDLVAEYGEAGLLDFASSAAEFVAAIEATLSPHRQAQEWLQRVDRFLAQGSWETTWQGIARLIEAELNVRRAPTLARQRIAQSRVGELLLSEISSLLGESEEKGRH